MSVLVTLAITPFVFGSVIAEAYYPLLFVAFVAGALSWGHAHWARAHGLAAPPVPATRLLLALIGLVLFQLVPLPPGLLKLVSPGSFAYYDYLSLVPLRAWRPISVSPMNTLRGLAFLAGMSLLYSVGFRDFRASRWRLRAVVVIVGTAFVMTLEALVQAASQDPRKIYGIWKPLWDWAAFGPYVSKNSFAGYLVMAIPLALAWAGHAVREVRQNWKRRRIGWVALGDKEAMAAIQRLAVAFVLLVGLLVSKSRGAGMAFVFSAIATPLLLGKRRWALVAVVVLTAGAFFLVGMNDVDLTRRAQQGLGDPRFPMWKDAVRMVPDFPVFGSGLNSFGTIYRKYQRAWPSVWFGEAHNEYLQVLFETGLVGLAVVGALLFQLLRAASSGATRGIAHSGVFGGLLAVLFHNLVDFNWQIPANAATFAVLAGLAVQAGALDPSRERRLESTFVDEKG